MHVDLVDLSVELERTPVEIVERHGRAEVDADVEGLACREGGGHGAFDGRAGDFLAVDGEHHFGRRAGLGDRGVHLDLVLAGHELVRRTRDVALDDHHVVLVDEIALVHVQREAPAGRRPARRAHPKRSHRARLRPSRGCSLGPGRAP